VRRFYIFNFLIGFVLGFYFLNLRLPERAVSAGIRYNNKVAIDSNAGGSIKFTTCAVTLEKKETVFFAH